MTRCYCCLCCCYLWFRSGVVAATIVVVFAAGVVNVVAFKNQLNIFVAMEKGEEMTRKLFLQFFFAKFWFEMRWAEQNRTKMNSDLEMQRSSIQHESKTFFHLPSNEAFAYIEP